MDGETSGRMIRKVRDDNLSIILSTLLYACKFYEYLK